MLYAERRNWLQCGEVSLYWLSLALMFILVQKCSAFGFIYCNHPLNVAFLASFTEEVVVCMFLSQR